MAFRRPTYTKMSFLRPHIQRSAIFRDHHIQKCHFQNTHIQKIMSSSLTSYFSVNRLDDFESQKLAILLSFRGFYSENCSRSKKNQISFLAKQLYNMALQKLGIVLRFRVDFQRHNFR